MIRRRQRPTKALHGGGEERGRKGRKGHRHPYRREGRGAAQREAIEEARTGEAALHCTARLTKRCPRRHRAGRFRSGSASDGSILRSQEVRLCVRVFVKSGRSTFPLSTSSSTRPGPPACPFLTHASHSSSLQHFSKMPSVLSCFSRVHRTSDKQKRFETCPFNFAPHAPTPFRSFLHLTIESPSGASYSCSNGKR